MTMYDGCLRIARQQATVFNASRPSRVKNAQDPGHVIQMGFISELASFSPPLSLSSVPPPSRRYPSPFPPCSIALLPPHFLPQSTAPLRLVPLSLSSLAAMWSLLHTGRHSASGGTFRCPYEYLPNTFSDKVTWVCTENTNSHHAALAHGCLGAFNGTQPSASAFYHISVWLSDAHQVPQNVTDSSFVSYGPMISISCFRRQTSHSRCFGGQR